MAKSSTAAQPIAQPTNDGSIAPWPVIDKWPVVIGPGLSLSYISSIFRLSLTGYRQQYVDLLDELLEKDPHAFSVLSKRILGVAAGRVDLVPAELADGTGSTAQKQAEDICRVCNEMLAQLPCLEQSLAELSWATYYALAGQEIHWQRDGSGWFPERLSMVHSRRMAYPVSGSWDLYIWDQGQVLSTFDPMPTNSRIFGARVADYPGKFIVHAPQIRGGYPTRNGLGRQIAYWLALKLVATRSAPQYLERFAKPWPEATYWTADDANRRAASEEDIASAQAALAAMGAGSLSSWVHPDTVRLDLRTPDSGAASKLTFAEWISICDQQVSKAVVGGTLTTDVGHNGGNRALGETQKKGETQLLKYDAKLLGAVIRRDLVSWMVKLNFPNAPATLVPRVMIHVEDPPDPMTIIQRAAAAANAGMPVDADAVANETGIPLVETGDLKARRMFPIMASKTPERFDADLAARAEELTPEVTEQDPNNPDASGDTEEEDDAGNSSDAEP